MIEPKDLHHNGIYHYNGGIVQVKIEGRQINYLLHFVPENKGDAEANDIYKGLEPIPLTNSLLTDLGLDKYLITPKHVVVFRLIERSTNFYAVFLKVSGQETFVRDVQYLHDFQAFYFANTGVQLELTQAYA